MQRFFDDFDSIHQFTRSLDYHQDKLACAHCLKNDQWVSHGVVYKQRAIAVKAPVGKRIFCSNRYGRSGCGRTFQLYVASEFPSFQYGAAHLFVFITSLLLNLTVSDAYHKATAQFEPRNAWRWLKRLMRRLSEYRCFLKTRSGECSTPLVSKSGRLQCLLPTLARLFTTLSHCPCASYQFIQQNRFI